MISKDTFVKIMNALQDSADRADKMDDAINPLIQDRTTVTGRICFAEFFCDWKMQSEILEALSVEVFDEKDEYGEGWIEYFVYELDWGRKWTPDSIRDRDGKCVYMRDAGELYDYLSDQRIHDLIHM